MKYQQECECCGHVVKAYSHKLNKPMVNALRQLVDYFHEHKTLANLQKDLNLTKNQYNNFQKLQYFKLVARSKHGWCPTALGMDFIAGVVLIDDTAATHGKEILDGNHEAWQTHTGKVKTVRVWDIDRLSYKKREEYADEGRLF